uniref:Uncharacterized protein n=1 Tax=Oryza sativa subsp. japonica TaxID=39947 RepID=Q6Z5Y9_ORYSJ|nr:hypothetical protein [Oryza sativa Japonica Group]
MEMTTLDRQRIRLDWIKTLGKTSPVNGMGAAVAGEPQHNSANGGHREVEKATAILTNTYATTDSEGDGRRCAPKGREVLVNDGDGEQRRRPQRRRGAARDMAASVAPARALQVMAAAGT